jgi:hypothetical protein
MKTNIINIMKHSKLTIIFKLLIVLLIAGACTTETHDSRLTEEFFNPPATARPHTYWFWMDGNITREGITADLEAMAESGIGGALIFNTGESHGTEIPSGPVDYMSDQWVDMVKFAASEAERLGLTLGANNCAGWSSMGGPWIKPEHGSQRFVSTAVKIDGGKRIVTKLAQPETKLNYYRDIAVIAYPTVKNEAYRVDKWINKAAQQGWGPGKQPDFSTCPTDAAIGLDGIVDLSKYLSNDGTLTWNAPKGSWTILRLGHTPMGQKNSPAPESGRGLEVDKLNRAAVDAQWKYGIKPILDRLGPLAGEVFETLHIDSYESGMNQWTSGMRQEFKKRRGYDLMPYFPALTGRLVIDGPTTERFLWDYRQTVSELFTENYYGYVAEVCHDNGMKFSTEPYYGPYEGLAVAAKADLPMGEFWVGGDDFPSLKLASSVAHVNGGNLVGAEAFTAQPNVGRWQNYPAKHKVLGDLVWTEGINRLVFHAFVHQPFSSDIVPGMTFGQWGSHFDRNVTWLKPGKEWIQYVTRSQYLLQHGDFAADVLFFGGEASPNGGVNRKDIKNAGFDYDACGTDIFAKLTCDNGDIVLPCGRRYRLLVMPETPFQAPHIVSKVRDLVAAGATVLSSKPKQSPTLTGYPASEKEVLAIADQVWGNCDGKTVKSNPYGKGQLFDGLSPVDVLDKLNVSPAVKLPEGLAWIHRRTDDTDLFFVSNQSDKTVRAIAGFRTAGKKPEFFDAEQGTVTDAAGWTVDGEHVKVPLNLAPEKSVFVVFRNSGKPESDPYVSAEGPDGEPLDFDTNKSVRLRAWVKGTHTLRQASGKTSKIEVAALPESLNLDGPWNVRFQEKRGAPEKAHFDKLISWSEHSDPGIQYFSGTATNTIKFKLPKDFLKKNQQVWLDLGEVAVIAEVRLNGKELGVIWHKPFRIEVGEALRPDSNTLEVDVTNLWINRLIGDEQYPTDCKYNDVDMGWYTNRALTQWPEWLTSGKERPVKDRVTFTTWKHWDKDDKLQRSGLIGPVTLRCANLVPLPQE